jgi:NAD(P)H dehydrogenase (quinone)
MSRILVLYYSSYGHIEKMADAVAEGALAAGASVDIRRVAETAPKEVVEAGHFKTDTAHAIIESPEKLGEYDGIVVGAPTRFGRMPSQMAGFWDTTGGLWFTGKLIGKVGAAFTSTAAQHGGQETTLFSILTNLLHHGMTIVGLDYGFQGQMGVDVVRGGSPYGASTISNNDGSRMPSAFELDGARYLGKRVAETADKLFKAR